MDDDTLNEHLKNIRKRAWILPYYQYSFLGRWWFLRSIFASTPAYQSILSEAKNGASILDAGCGLVQELRYLRAAGAKGEMYAVDEYQELWDLGLELFADKQKITSKVSKSTDDMGMVRRIGTPPCADSRTTSRCHYPLSSAG